ncbi:N-acetylglucosaminyl-diphospho-decaprenol L-rhamnosyltransferase [mine drainage metagenome]|uniref:N-acetylglucosaminyl-diphospho-decaprenol L-rhamnosyltransferase n=1 Tax=mine drainage metagenome TaxID=410659 RepID=A0A1J5SFC8_9ZZZZ
MNKKAAIIIVNWNSYNYTFQCINSINQTNNHEFDIIVVDNNSEDGSGIQLKEAFNNIVLIQSDKNTGFAGGNNLGIRYAIDHGYEYSFMLNNDTVVPQNFLSPLIEYMESHTGIGMIQPKIYFNHDRSLLWNGGSYYNHFLGLTYTSNHFFSFFKNIERIKKVDWVTGCAFLAKNSVLEEVGYFDEKFFMYYEDVDLSFRIKKAGHTLIYHPASVVYHEAGASLKKKVKTREGYLNPYVHYLNARNKIYFLRKHTAVYYLPGVIVFSFLHSVAFIGYFVARGRFSKLNSFLKGLKDGLFEKKTNLN